MRFQNTFDTFAPAILGITEEKSQELHDCAWRRLAKMMVDDAKERGEF